MSARWYRRYRFVLWGARGHDVQIGGFVDHSFAEFARLGWLPGPLRHSKAGW